MAGSLPTGQREPFHTWIELGKLAGVSGFTVQRTSVLLKKAPAETLAALRGGGLSIDAAWQILRPMLDIRKRAKSNRKNAV
jgi:hypothetical protein